MTKKKKITILTVVCVLLPVLYVLSYTINSACGGYWMKPVLDKRDRYSEDFGGLAMPTAIHWQPAVGYFALGKRDLIGTFYSPLIKLDRRHIHPTKYMSDSIFDWANGLAIEKIHPEFRDETRKAREKHNGEQKPSQARVGQ